MRRIAVRNSAVLLAETSKVTHLRKAGHEQYVTDVNNPEATSGDEIPVRAERLMA